MSRTFRRKSLHNSNDFIGWRITSQPEGTFTKAEEQKIFDQDYWRLHSDNHGWNAGTSYSYQRINRCFRRFMARQLHQELQEQGVVHRYTSNRFPGFSGYLD